MHEYVNESVQCPHIGYFNIDHAYHTSLAVGTYSENCHIEHSTVDNESVQFMKVFILGECSM